MGRGNVMVWVFVLASFGGLVVATEEEIIMEEDSSTPCLLSSADQLNYMDALGKAILFFEGQRSGKLPAGGQRVNWRGDSALSDGRLENVDLVGGYYDAGDNVKFGWPMSFTCSLLSWAAVEYGTRVSSANQLGYLQSAIRWGTDFILKAYVSNTTLYTQVGDGNSDHQCWERPEDMDTPRTLHKITSSSPGTEAAADASAALASASMVFKTVDPEYSSKLLSTSRSLFDFANTYRGSYQSSCPFYCSYSGYQDELLWAAAWLYKATKAPQYLNFVTTNQGWSQSVTEFSWDNKFPGAQALLAMEYFGGEKDLAKFKSDADSFVCSLMPKSGMTRVQTTPGGLLFTRDSANLQYVTSASFVMLFYSKILQSSQTKGIQCGSVQLSSTQIIAFAKSQTDYILGKNPLGISYMAGFGAKYPLRVHHRGASIPSIKIHPTRIDCKGGFTAWLNTNNPNPNIHVGAIVGGPNSNDQFNDVRSDSSHLEPTTYMNAAFVGTLAALLSGQSCELQLLLPVGNSAISMV